MVLQKFGLLASIWILLQAFVGAGSVWFDGKLFGGGMKAKGVWKYHRLISRFRCHDHLRHFIEGGLGLNFGKKG